MKLAVYKILPQYQWKVSTVSVEAKVAGEVFEKIEAENGSVTPELVLDNSRDEGAALHKCFEWDDSVAAENYRLHQAGFLIRNLITVVVKEEPEDVTPSQYEVRAFVNVSTETAGKYVAIERAFNEEETLAIVLKNAHNELIAFQRKYSVYSELADVCKMVGGILATMQGK